MIFLFFQVTQLSKMLDALLPSTSGDNQVMESDDTTEALFLQVKLYYSILFIFQFILFQLIIS